MGDETSNAITHEGMASVATLIMGLGAGAASVGTYAYIQIGTDATAAAAADTALGAGTHDALATTHTTSSSGGAGIFSDECNWSYTWAAGQFNGQTIAEAGVFSAASVSSPTMLSRCTFTGVTLTASDSLQIDYDIVVKQGT